MSSRRGTRHYSHHHHSGIKQHSSKGQRDYRQFMAEEMRNIKKQEPDLSQPEIMKMAAAEWRKYKGESGPVKRSSTRSTKSRRTSGSKTSRSHYRSRL